MNSSPPTSRTVVKPARSVRRAYGHGPDRLLGDAAPEVVDRVLVPVLAHLARQVDVGVEEAGEKRHVAEVDDGRPGRHRKRPARGRDLLPLDDHDRVGDERVGDAVEEAGGTDRDDGGLCGLRGRRGLRGGGAGGEQDKGESRLHEDLRSGG